MGHADVSHETALRYGWTENIEGRCRKQDSNL